VRRDELRARKRADHQCSCRSAAMMVQPKALKGIEAREGAAGGRATGTRRTVTRYGFIDMHRHSEG
jgi:hypothetical protein